MNDTREFDIIVWGATGFTGRLVAEYLFNTYGANNAITWAMGGRNQAKLEKVRADVADDTVPLVIADSHDEESLHAMVQRARVICTTVGPYARYGDKLVAACVANQTDYCDLTGEVHWMRRMIDLHHETAGANGTKIVHTCGFDSIPSDMGVFFVQREAKAKMGERAQQIKMRVKAFAGAFSGGTYASMTDQMELVAKDRSYLDIVHNPYALNPVGEQNGPDERDLQRVVYDEASQSWIYPFVMGSINTRVVRRSNALAGYPYGKDFRYDEASMGGDGFAGRVKAILTASFFGIFTSAKPGSLLKKGLDRLMPKPGEGPSKEKREAGFYDFRFIATLTDGSTAVGKVTGDMDPGYGSTSKIVAESAICLAKDELPNIGGVLTPSIAMGEALLVRLQQNAGLTFSYQEGESAG